MNEHYRKIITSFPKAVALSMVAAAIVGGGLYAVIRAIDSGAQARAVAEVVGFFGLWIALYPIHQWYDWKTGGRTVPVPGRSFTGYVCGAALASLLYLGFKLAVT
jgi:hypothetical protein